MVWDGNGDGTWDVLFLNFVDTGLQLQWDKPSFEGGIENIKFNECINMEHIYYISPWSFSSYFIKRAKL